MPREDHYVIIGNGPAGNSCAETLRREDSRARITIISDEKPLHYYKHRVPLFAVGGCSADELTVRPYRSYREKNIRLRLGQRVERVDPGEKVLYLKHMEKVHYTRLILAVGASCRMLTSHASFAEHLHCISGYDDARNLQDKMEKASRIAILGGDLTSMGFAREARNAGKEVVFILYSSLFWPVNLKEEIHDKVTERLSSLGVEVIDGCEPVSNVAPLEKGYRITLPQGETLEADLVFSFFGTVPNIRFLVGSGINTEKGVLVDDLMRTNQEGVYACGDCAQIFNPEFKDYWSSVGWGNAEKQGEVTAMNLLGASQVIDYQPKEIFEMDGVTIRTSWWKSFS
ncbi:MAG: NAD(P)/FAD-dependent oxidoreductase [Desulfobacterales bacterium]|nr:NAD(P)/FAD-dependent oxidoreductase [Desulfobacterales bacterium]